MELTWTAPGPGQWRLEASHLVGVPTPIYAAIHRQTIGVGVAGLFERYGVPLRTMDEHAVNGFMYTQLAPLVGKAGASPPPRIVLWLVTRLHPAFRTRTKAAARAIEDRIWRARTEEWHGELRPRVREANLALQAEDIGALDGAGLADHLRRAHTHVVEGHVLHFDLHGDDLGPLGLYLGRCMEWGIEPTAALAALAGHSPSTKHAVLALADIAAAATAAGADPARCAALEELRALGSEVAAALDAYLDEYGSRVVTAYDVDARTVAELPAALVANVAAAARPRPPIDGEAAATSLRASVPDADRDEFDRVLGEARVALDLRDDNGPMTVEWPLGLLRRALLEAGARLHTRGALHDASDVFELALDDVLALVVGETVPGVDADAVTARRADRVARSAGGAPATLGEPDPEPDFSAFPAPLALVTRMAIVATALLERDRSEGGALPEPSAASAAAGVVARGLGVGDRRCTGVARVARSAEDALAAIEPGDVLMVPFTTPAFNAVLAVVGAVVTEEGGALSHAAVLARELGFPAIIGASGVLDAVPDGSKVEIDPALGTVTLV